jgi:hypothetical protein
MLLITMGVLLFDCQAPAHVVSPMPLHDKLLTHCKSIVQNVFGVNTQARCTRLLKNYSQVKLMFDHKKMFLENSVGAPSSSCIDI